MNSADFRAWVARAKTFIRNLAGLPGAVQLNDAIEPAATDNASLEWLASDKCSLPPEIRDFLTSASMRCGFFFEWHPPAEWRERLGEFGPGMESLSGGADLCESARYSNYDHRDWFRQVLGDQPLFQQMYSGTGIDEDRGDLLTLAPLVGGDRLALEIGPGHEARAVVYVFGTTAGSRKRVSASLGQFLLDWERICYLTPSYATLQNWTDATGLFHPDDSKADRLRAMFAGSPPRIDEKLDCSTILLFDPRSMAIMPDYSGWLRRAEAFVRATSTLPGNWSMKSNIAPPLGLEEADRLDRALPHGLPPLLRDFYVTASADVECRFTWTPDGESLSRLAEIIPHQYSIYAGPHFCSAGSLAEDHEQLIGLAEIFEDFAEYGASAAQTLRQCVPLISVGNGDYVALHVKAGPSQPGVIYVSHEVDIESDSPIIPLASTGEQFLTAWERLCYIGPEIWVLYPFLDDAKSGQLNADSPLANKWRSFLESFSLPV